VEVQKEEPESVSPVAPEVEDKPEGEPAPAEVPAAAEAPAEPEPAAARLAELEQEAAELRERLMRKQADFENFRKRVERERQEFAAYAAAELIRDILPVLDNLERALSYGESAGDARLHEGVEIINRQFQEILRKAGLREVEAQSQAFDPHVHEAVERVETSEHAEGTVVAVLQKGYLLRDRLLRPALVRVAKTPEGAEEPAPASPTSNYD
jgi:molecular chaperone GrpE